MDNVLSNIGIVTQNSTGDIRSVSNPNDRPYNMGYLALGQVLEVHPKSYTADVQIFQTNDKFRSSPIHEGKHACRIGVNSAGFSDFYEAPYGEILPIYRGNIVLVGFLKNMQNQPVIIKVFHDISEEAGRINFRNILPNWYNMYTNVGDIMDYLKIYPNQDFFKVDRFGNIELSSHTKSFLAIKEGYIPDTYDYEDLSVKSPTDKSIISPYSEMETQYYNDVSYDSEEIQKLKFNTVSIKENLSKPKSYLLSFRDKFLDSATNWLKVLVDAAKTSFRLFKFQQDKKQSTLVELDEEGAIKIRRQLDAMEFTDYKNTEKTELNPNQNPSKIYSEIRMLQDGTIVLETIDRTKADKTLEEGFSSMREIGGNESKDFPHTKVILHPKGGEVEIKTNSKMTTYAKAGLDLMSKDNINITSEKVINLYGHKGINELSPQDIVINSQKRTQLSSNSKVEMFAPNMDMTGAMEMKGSFDMTGAFDLLGNATFTGRHYINGRGAVLEGDTDSNGDINEAFFADRVASIAESFLMNELSKHITIPNTASAALTGVFNVVTSGFANENIVFNGTSSDFYNSLSLGLVSEVSPFYERLVNYATEKNLNLNSLATQIDFMKDVLGIDLENLTAGLTGTDAIVEGVNKLYNSFVKKNYIVDEVNKSSSKTTEYNLTDDEKTILGRAYISVPVELSPAALSNSLAVNAYNWFRGRDATPVIGIVREGNRVSVPGISGQGDNRYKQATIEDGLKSINEYFKTSLFRLVEQVENIVDPQLNTESYKYCYRDNTETNTSSSSGASSGSSDGLESKPARIRNKSQYIDRVIKRYYFNIGETILKQANSALKYANS